MASNNNHDMMQDLYLLALSAKGAACDPTAISPKQALAAATRTGALSQGREDCGYVGVGACADLCVLDVAGPSWTPMTNPLVNVVYAGHGADVCLTMCDGRVVYRDGSGRLWTRSARKPRWPPARGASLASCDDARARSRAAAARGWRGAAGGVLLPRFCRVFKARGRLVDCMKQVDRTAFRF